MNPTMTFLLFFLFSLSPCVTLLPCVVCVCVRAHGCRYLPLCTCAITSPVANLISCCLNALSSPPFIARLFREYNWYRPLHFYMTYILHCCYSSCVLLTFVSCFQIASACHVFLGPEPSPPSTLDLNLPAHLCFLHPPTLSPLINKSL